MKRTGQGVLWLVAVVLLVGTPALVWAQSGALQSPRAELASESAMSLLAAFYIPRIMEWLKHRSWFKLLQDGRERLNRGVAILTALATALSIHYSFSHGVDGWQLVIGGPHQTVLSFVGQVLAQYAGQQQVYEWMKAARTRVP